MSNGWAEYKRKFIDNLRVLYEQDRKLDERCVDLEKRVRKNEIYLAIAIGGMMALQIVLGAKLVGLLGLG